MKSSVVYFVTYGSTMPNGSAMSGSWIRRRAVSSAGHYTHFRLSRYRGIIFSKSSTLFRR